MCDVLLAEMIDLRIERLRQSEHCVDVCVNHELKQAVSI